MEKIPYLIIAFFLSMLPVIELRGGVPFATVFGNCNELTTIFICTIGNMIPVPFIYFFGRKFLNWGVSKKIFRPVCNFFLTKGDRAGQKLAKKASRQGFFLALLLFVGIPLPGTGAWTGTLAASFLNMGFRSTVASVLLGVLLAGIIMALSSGTAVGVFSVIFG